MQKVARGLVAWLALAVLLGCSTSYQALKTDYGQSVFTAKYKAGEYSAKVDNFVVILDASYSMNEAAGDKAKFEQARNLVSRLNHAVPAMPLKAALYSFGGNYSGAMALHYGPKAYSASEFENALKALSQTGWVTSRLDKSVKAAKIDLANSNGRTAVIVVSDGEAAYNKCMRATDKLKQAYGDRVCVYTIQLGDSVTGAKLLKDMAKTQGEGFATKDLAKEGGCGFATTAAEVDTDKGMNAFVEKVFLTRGKKAAVIDSDGDGVPDSLDKCPATPKGAAVDKQGCPLDSDGDGVFDYKDLCPNTPKGTLVDDHGCALSQPKGAETTAKGSWILREVQFDYGKADIRADIKPVLNEVVKVLGENPAMRLEIQGHTDDRGAADYNLKLSSRRAAAVRDYLVSMGVGAERLRAVGYGKNQPMATNATADGRAKNRRVEFFPIR